jgi:hypothetical protein
MAQQRAYAVDPLRESGLLKNQAHNSMYAIALALPAHYREMRTNLEVSVTHQLTKSLYDIIFAALRDGKTPAGVDLVPLTAQEFARFRQVGQNAYRPNIPEKEVNEVAYECATSLIQMLQDKVVDKIMPVDLSHMATEKIAAKTTMKIASGQYSNP